MTALPALLSLFLVATTPSADGVDQDVDALAPFLGKTLLDAEDLAREAADPLQRPSDSPALEADSPASAPLWTRILPALSISLVERNAKLIEGVDALGLRSGTILLVQATFGGAKVPTGDSNAREDRLARSVAAIEPAPTDAQLLREPGLPTVAEVQEAAERASLVHRGEVSSWRSRAREPAWLPELSADYQRNVGEIDTLGIESNLGIDSHNIEDVTRYGVRATWQLSQLVFSREEVAATRTALAVQRNQQELVAHVTELYFRRLRARARGGHLGDGTAGASLEVAELGAQIDALTDGFLTRRLQDAQLVSP